MSDTRRSRRRLAVVLLIPLLELILLVAAADRFGAGPVLLIMLVSALIGAMVIRRGTPRAWATVRELAGLGPTPDHHLSRNARAASGKVLSPYDAPQGTAGLRAAGENLKAVGADLTEDLLLLISGLALLWPGLITTVVGVLLLIPGVRPALARRLSNRAATATTARVERFVQQSRAQVHGSTVIQGQTVDRAGFQPNPPSRPDQASSRRPLDP